jgi:hypothetical protein
VGYFNLALPLSWCGGILSPGQTSVAITGVPAGGAVGPNVLDAPTYLTNTSAMLLSISYLAQD